MLVKYLIAIIIRMIPESILMVKGAQLLSGHKGDSKKLVYSGIALGIATFLIRQLPINFGVHTLIYMMIYIAILLKIFNIEMFKGISSALICIVMLALMDTAVMILYTRGLGISGEWLFSGEALAFILSDLSLLFFISIVGVIKTFKEEKAYGNS